MKPFSKLFSGKKKQGRVNPAPSMIAANPSAAPKNTTLPDDVDVRLVLASRLAALFPAQEIGDLARLYAFVVQSLGSYALDEVLRIRLALSTALKDCGYVSPKELGALVQSVERDISEPILRFCAGLRDEDLLEILGMHAEDWVVRVVKGRAREQNAPTMFTAPEEFRIEDIITLAKETREWHEHSGAAVEMPSTVAADIDSFIDASVFKILSAKAKIDEDTISEIMQVFRRRMALIAQKKRGADIKIPERIETVMEQGNSGNDIIADGIAVRDMEFVKAALALMSGAPVNVIEDVISARAPTPLVALCWKAGFSMRIALLLQQELAQIPPKRLIYPKDGTDFPFTQNAMREQLAFLGVRGT